MYNIMPIATYDKIKEVARHIAINFYGVSLNELDLVVRRDLINRVAFTWQNELGLVVFWEQHREELEKLEQIVQYPSMIVTAEGAQWIATPTNS